MDKQNVVHPYNAILFSHEKRISIGFPRWLSGKESACNSGDIRNVGSIPESGRGNGNTFQYSSLENPMDRGAWGAMVHRVAKRHN